MNGKEWIMKRLEERIGVVKRIGLDEVIGLDERMGLNEG